MPNNCKINNTAVMAGEKVKVKCKVNYTYFDKLFADIASPQSQEATKGLFSVSEKELASTFKHGGTETKD